MYWVPKIVYNNGGVVTLNLTWPQKQWEPKSKGVGGTDRSASGVVESFNIRREHLVTIGLRFTEEEWSDIDQWLSYFQDNQGSTFDFYFEKTDNATLYTVYLDSPSLEDGDIEPKRSSRHGIYEIDVVLRNSANQRFDVKAYA